MADEEASIQVIQIPDQPLRNQASACPDVRNTNGDTETSSSVTTTWQCECCQLATPSDSSTAPEKEVTMCAIQLAVLEKAASGLGALGFVWATVVLLGGFAITLQWKDFGFVAVTLLIESTRIVSRSHELELHHQSTWSLTEVSQCSYHAIKSRSRCLVRSLRFIVSPCSMTQRSRVAEEELMSSGSSTSRRRSMWRSHNMQQLPLSIRFISGLFYWLQLFSAMACIVLSMIRLVSLDFGPIREADKGNRDFALIVFYVLALADALVFLAEKAFWEWKVSYCGLLEKVNAEYRLGPSGLISIKRFFYDVYSRCVTGSVFDGLKMDLVTFAEELLVSSSDGEQLMGARILLSLSTHQRLSDAAIRKIETSTVVIERLIEMLTWKEYSEQEARYSAAVVVSKLADKEQNAFRVGAIPGAMESISSLLYSGATSTHGPKYDFLTFNLLGLSILKKLARKRDNCVKMGHICGLLDRIVEFMSICEGIDPKAVKRSLQVVKLLAGMNSHTGSAFRREISGILLTSSNIRDILRHGAHYPALQRLALDVIGKLAMDAQARERIGKGGMVDAVLDILFRLPARRTHEQCVLRAQAGEALAMLALDNQANCRRILEHGRAVKRLVEALEEPPLRVSCSKVLQRLCASAGPEWYRQLNETVAGFHSVLKDIVSDKEEQLQLLEASLGLAAQMVMFMSSGTLRTELHRAGLSEYRLVKKLILIMSVEPSTATSQIIELAADLSLRLMAVDKSYVSMFRAAGLTKEVVGQMQNE